MWEMAVVPVDNRGRLTLPKDVVARGSRAVVIPAGSFVVVIPLPEEPVKHAGSWLPSMKSRKDLKKMAEEQARKDAAKRARRRRQI
jgi:hypothetical protein